MDADCRPYLTYYELLRQPAPVSTLDLAAHFWLYADPLGQASEWAGPTSEQELQPKPRSDSCNGRAS